MIYFLLLASTVLASSVLASTITATSKDRQIFTSLPDDITVKSLNQPATKCQRTKRWLLRFSRHTWMKPVAYLADMLRVVLPS